MKHNWMKDIPDFEKYFTRDQRDAIKAIGFDAYMLLHDRFEKTSIHFSSTPIMMLKKAWAIINKHIAYNEAARILGVSEKTIYNWREEKNADNYNLFEDKK